MKKDFPKWANRFLEWYCRPELLEEIQGDLYELFEVRVARQGVRKARIRFAWDVLRSCRLSTIKHIRLNPSHMLSTHNLKMSFRHLWRQKFYSLVNVFGLVMGFVCCFFIGLYIWHETSYDRHHRRSEDLYRLLLQRNSDGQTSRSIYQNPPLADLLASNIPEVEGTCRLRTGPARLVKAGLNGENHYEELFMLADRSLLELFQLPLKYGQRENALQAPFSILLTEEKAIKYFGVSDPVGQAVYFDNDPKQPYTVTGVIQDIAAPSHLQYDFYISMTSIPEDQLDNWNVSSYPTYLQLRPGTNIARMEAEIMRLAKNYKKNLAEEPETTDGLPVYRFELQAVPDIYLQSKGVFAFGHWPTGDVRYSWLFGSIALCILLLAVINFINLSTARATVRTKEIGVKKIIGSSRRHLVGQFLTEAVLQSLIAVVISLGIIKMVYPLFAGLLDQSPIIPWTFWWFVPGLIVTAVLIGLVAGVYPSFYLSSFTPSQILRNKVNRSGKAGLRSGLVIVQFVTTIILIFGTLLIYRQMQYVQQKHLGYDKEQVLVIEDTYTLDEQVSAFKTSLEKMAAVSSVSISSFLPVDGYVQNGSSFQHPDSSRGPRQVELQRWFIDDDYLSTLDMELVAGRNFSSDFRLDTSSIILNETAADLLGFEDPIGKRIAIDVPYTIIGVVRDFHFKSMKDDISGLAFHRGLPQFARSTILRYNTTDHAALIGAVNDIWKTFAPDQQLRYHFLDERFDLMYTAEKRTGTLFALFTGIAVLVACLGLLALANFVVTQRKKELSIRKVLGASITNIFRLQVQLYVKLMFIAAIIGIPIGYLMMQNWLSDFAYRVGISWDSVLLSVLISIALVLMTVSYQAIKLAISNPVNALKE